MARILPFPWSLIAPRNTPSADFNFSVEDCDRRDPLNPETLVLYTWADETPRPGSEPKLSSHHESGVRTTENVITNPLSEVGRRPGYLWITPWPHDSSGAWKLKIGSVELELQVSGGVRRANGREVQNKANEHSVALRETVDQLCGYFAESRSLASDERKKNAAVGFGLDVVKLAWEAIWTRWAASAAGTEPRTARVVEIARSYRSNIREVCERPRRMLVRQRELVPVGKIQELDETCLRDLIRRPGRTIPEKAGSRQELLGITRRETVDTAENRVIRDFLRLCQHRAVSYQREYPQPAPLHAKVQAVVDLRRNCERWDAASPISLASKLVGLPKSNYVLEKDRRYHALWNQYQLLRKEEDMVDKVWPWARRLWADFVRSLFVGFLSAQSTSAAASWHLVGTLPAYVRAEHSSGSFVPALSISSRWKHATADEELWIVHGAHAHLCPGLQTTLPRLGADLVIACFAPKRAGETPTGLLTIHSLLSLDTTSETRDAAVESLAATLDVVAKLHSEIRHVKGLLLRGESLSEAKPLSRQKGRLDYLSAPVGCGYWFTEFPTEVSKLLEKLRP
jgi:Domain of unknown function (DUF2357)